MPEGVQVTGADGRGVLSRSRSHGLDRNDEELPAIQHDRDRPIGAGSAWSLQDEAHRAAGLDPPGAVLSRS
jgi:hypothetical protein